MMALVEKDLVIFCKIKFSLLIHCSTVKSKISSIFDFFNCFLSSFNVRDLDLKKFDSTTIFFCLVIVFFKK